ncbi:MAG: ATP-binding protein [Fibrobacterota bacterium]
MVCETNCNEISVSFPATIEYIPILREFVSDSLKGFGFSDKFSYRMEIMVDELAVNAVEHGSLSQKSRVDLNISIQDDFVSLNVKDEGGSRDKLNNLQEALISSPRRVSAEGNSRGNLGLEIVKMLAESVDVTTEGETVTKVRVKRKGGNN